MRGGLILLISILGMSMGYSQDPMYFKYTTFDGLSHNAIFDLLQTKDGHIYVATMSGLCKYNGDKFESIGTKDGLASNVSLVLFEDSKERLWVSHYRSFPSVITKDSIRKVVPRDSTALSNGASYFCETDSGDILIGTKNRNVLIIKDVEAIPYKHTSLRTSVIINHFDWMSLRYNTSILGLTLDKLLKFPNELNRHWLRRYSNDYPEDFEVIGDTVQFNSKITQRRIQTILNEFGNEGRLFDLCKFTEDEWWFGTDKKGILKVCFGGAQIIKHTYILDGYTAHEIIKDRDGGIWVGTASSGLIYIPQPKTSHVRFEDKKIWDIFSSKSTRCFVFKDNTFRIDYYENGRYREGEIQSLPFKERLLRVDVLGNGRYCFVPDLYLQQEQKGWFYIYSKNPVQRISYTGKANDLEMHKDELWMGNLYGLFKRVDGEWLQSKRWAEKFDYMPIHDIYFQEDTAYFSTDKGLYMHPNPNVLFDDLYEGKDSLVETGINAETIFYKGKVSVYTSGGGNLIFHSENEVVDVIDKLKLEHPMSTLTHPSENQWWMTSGNTICQFFPLKDISFSNKYSVVDFGMMDAPLRSVRSYRDSIQLATEKSVTSFPVDGLLSKSISLDVELNACVESTVGERKILCDNSFELKLSPCYYNSHENLKYFAQLSGHEDFSSESSSNTFSFPALEYGDYTVDVWAEDNSGNKSGTHTFQFRVPTPLIRQTWFQVVLSLLLGAGIAALIVAFLKRRLALKERIASVELRALRSQMNPHFTFNVLGAIQSKMLTDKTKEANFFIKKYAKLMRQVLNQARFESITFDEEMDLLDNYLSLEQLRLSNRFEYKIKIDDEIDGEERIPSMLLQPFVENAIVHGISNLTDKKGEIEVECTLLDNDDGIKIVIRDNGIGRKAAKKLNQMTRQKHKSHALSISKERIDLYNQLFNTKLKYYFVDLETEDLQIGTELHIIIPILN